jgi:hypothetical protein
MTTNTETSMPTRIAGPLLASTLATLVALLLPAVAAAANDYPTVARVEYVIDCMRDAKTPPQESLYKCSCVIDNIAQKVSYDEFVELSTLANAIPIAGERGGALRDLKDGRKRVSSLRQLQGEARKACLVDR